MERITLFVTGMNCLRCEAAIKTALEAMGAVDVLASKRNKTVDFAYNPAKLKLADVKDEISRIGYYAE